MVHVSTKAALLELIARERGRLLEAVKGLTDKQMLQAGVKPRWCVADILAHLSAWERRMVRRVHAVRRGSRSPTELDTKSFNELVFWQNHDRPLLEIRREASRSYRAALKLVESLTEVERRDPEISAVVRSNTWRHYRWASAKVRAWRRREQIPPRADRLATRNIRRKRHSQS